MSDYLKRAEEMWKKYKEWVLQNPAHLHNIESVIKWSSLTVAGKMSKSDLLPEFVFVATNMMTFFHDIIISEERRLTWMSPMDPLNVNKRNVSYALTAIYHVEVLVELFFRDRYSEKTKWTLITTIQLIKLVSNLYLIMGHKCIPLRYPPAPLRQPPPPSMNDEQWRQQSLLNRSRRNIKKLDPEYYSPLNMSEQYHEWDSSENTKKQEIAEYMYVFKPMVHLISMAFFGQKSWQQYVIPLAIDLTSLYFHRFDYNKLSYIEKIEISRRKLRLLYYLMKSPIYEMYTERKLKGALATASKLPLIGSGFAGFLSHLDKIQTTYFNVWD